MESVLIKIRLTYFFYIFFVVFLVVSFFLPQIAFEGAALTLFSVNSFLYGFYISPILGAQKGRIEDLHRIVRSEAIALFSLMIKTKDLPDDIRSNVQKKVAKYVQAKLDAKSAIGGEEEYEDAISYCLEYKGKHKDDMDKILDGLVANQQNRTNFAMQMNNKVFSNEWMVMMILFSITIGFIALLDLGDSPALLVIRALLCTGLTMLIIILVKLSTLTHKKAKEIWNPLQTELVSRFYKIDQ